MSTQQRSKIKTVRKNLGLCGFSMGANACEVDVQDNKVVRIRPLHFDKAYSREEMNPWKVEARGTVFEPTMKTLIPPFCLVYKKRVYSPNRIPYPLKRIDWDPRGARNPQNRGISKFVRISWDEAAELIAQEIKRVQKEYGPYSILAQADGHGETKIVHGGHGCQTKLLALTGGYTLQARNPDSWEGWYWGGKHIWGFDPLGQGPQVNLWLDVSQYTEMLLSWGCDPETTPWGWVGQQASRMYFWFRELGIKQVFICPDLNYGAAIHADKWIPVLPNTDAALHLAIAYTWLTENDFDREYVDTHVVGFPEFRAYVLGESDGIPKTPKWAQPITGVPSYTIKALARTWAKKITAIAHGCGGGMIRSSYSTEPARLEICLLAMQGVGRPGRCVIKTLEWDGPRFAGPQPAFDHNLRVAAQGWVFELPEQIVPKTLIPEAILSDETLTWYGTTLWPWPVEDQFAQYQYPIEEGGSRIHMIWTDSPCWTTCWNHGNKMVEALRSPKIECVVAQHQWLENDCLMADIILPVTTKFEEQDIGNDRSSGQFVTVLYEEQAIPPLGEAKSDYEAVGEVAKKLGLYEEYTQGKTVEEWIEYGFNNSGLAEATTLESFKEKGYYVVPTMKGFFPDLPPGMRAFYEDPENNPLETPTGKIEFVSTNLKTVFPDDKERPPLPQFIPYGETQQESKLHPRAEKYPFLLVSNHGRWRLHAQFDDVPWFREISTCKVKGLDGYLYEPLWINPLDAAKMGVKDGDIMRIYNERGSVLGGVYVTERIIPGAVYQDHGARIDPIVLGEYDRGGANNLICPGNIISPNCAGEVTNNFLVALEKADVEELRRQYPEAFERKYDPAVGLVCDSWIVKEDGEK